ncbi:hypothetical protein D3C87_1213040 [compost metagenome]
MNRRNFILSSVLSGVALSAAKPAAAEPGKKEELCVMKMDHVTAEATYFARYEHFHILAIPISVLIAPPAQGYKVRTSPLDQDSLDEKAFAEFIKDSGLDASSLRVHSHEVNFTQAELERIASGEKEVQITVKTPKGNIGHHFFFTAPRSAIVKIQRGREVKKA